jgi:hypothetical protein
MVLNLFLRVLEKFLFGNDLRYGVRKIQQVDVSSDSSSEEDHDDKEEEDAIPKDKLGKRLWGEKFREKKKKRKAAWQDEDDDSTRSVARILWNKNVCDHISLYRVKDVTATYTKAVGKHGNKETSDEKYSKALKKKYLSIVGTPKWADLDQDGAGGDDSDDEFFRVSHFLAWQL